MRLQPSEPSTLGRAEPRLCTPPLVSGPPGGCLCGCALTRETSYGFAVIDFARDVLRAPLLPWQELAVIHGGELLPDGRPRFRVLLIVVARQNGKTHLLMVLALFWQFIEQWPLILGTSTKLDYARESWTKAWKLAERVAARSDPDAVDFAKLIPRRPRSGAFQWKREANGEQESWTVDPETKAESRYKIAASNEEGGRSLTINRLVCDELRQHHDYSAWSAAEPAASPGDAQIWCLSNAGDDRSVVLNDHRDEAIEFMTSGDGDHRLGLLEWSAPENADPEDVDALLQANPATGYFGKDLETLLQAARSAKRKGGAALVSFKTEKMCIRQRHENPAIDSAAWEACLEVGTMDELRDRVAVCLDVAPDEQHATLAAAAVQDDGRVRLEVVKAWDGADTLRDVRLDLPGLLARVKPRVLGWLPNGPAAALAATLKKREGREGWPPKDVEVEEIRGEVPAICMGFAAAVKAREVVHSGDPLGDAHVGGAEKLMEEQVGAAEKLKRGEVWVFSRRGKGHVDAAYALAGAAHLARTLPKREVVGKPRLIVVD